MKTVTATDRVLEVIVRHLLPNGALTTAAVWSDKGHYQVPDYTCADALDMAIAQSMKERQLAYVLMRHKAAEVAFGVPMLLSDTEGVQPFDPELEGQIVVVSFALPVGRVAVTHMPIKFEDGYVMNQDPVTMTFAPQQLPHDIPGLILIQELAKGARQ